MPKHYTAPSPSKKLRYAAGPTTIANNKKRRIAKHLKRQPDDAQSRTVLEGL